MPEFRRDPISGRWVVIAAERASRPFELALRETPIAGRDGCPFCPGHEWQTPEELLAYRDGGSPPNQPGWRVRVVPNKYPALAPIGPALGPATDEFFQAVVGHGAHEVILESPEHVVSLTDLPTGNVADALRVYRDRLRAHRAAGRFAYALLFKNVGASAGASIEHTHTQLLVMPVVPPWVREELDAARAFSRQTGQCAFCTLIARERAAGVRLILDAAGFVAVAAYAGRMPFETWLLPTTHSPRFEDAADEDLGNLAGVLHELLRRLESVVDRPAYNLVLHTSPLGPGDWPHYHWHLELLPRLSLLGGFEWGTGCYINPVSPETAAARLRDT